MVRMNLSLMGKYTDNISADAGIQTISLFAMEAMQE